MDINKDYRMIMKEGRRLLRTDNSDIEAERANWHNIRVLLLSFIGLLALLCAYYTIYGGDRSFGW